MSGVVGFEKARRFLQQGTVAGAGQALAGAKALGRRVPPIDAAIQAAQGFYLIGKEGARDGHAEAGKELTKKPLLYQLGKALLNPEDSLSKYGAYKEAVDKKAFEKIFEGEPWVEFAKKQNAQVQPVVR